jgi:hypothetical protein
MFEETALKNGFYLKKIGIIEKVEFINDRKLYFNLSIWRCDITVGVIRNLGHERLHLTDLVL